MGAAPAPQLDELSREECLALLGGASVGRIAVNLRAGSPLVVPVNFALDGEVIVFRTDPGSKLTALRERPVSFQVDDIDPFHKFGWSVLVRGIALVVPAARGGVDVEPWAPGPMEHWVRITPVSIEGRRLSLASADPDERGYL